VVAEANAPDQLCAECALQLVSSPDHPQVAMKLMVEYLPPTLRPDEEALIEAIITWAAAECRIHGRLPDLPIRIATLGGEVLLRFETRALDEDEDDDAVVRFRNIELT
jgi:hypothetical protein